ncbi:hypothetical protein Aduo_015952 [Ancylostoma duodenale]
MLVKTKCTDTKLDTIDFDGLHCLFSREPDFAEYRTRLLRKLDQSEKITLKDLTAECQLIKSYKEDSRMLEGGLYINAVHYRKNFNRKKEKREESDATVWFDQPPSPQSSDQKGSSRSQIRRPPHLDVTINGHTTQLLLGTGAEITIVSESKWKLFGKPHLQKTNVTSFAANGTPLKIRGCFDAEFAVSNSSGGQCFGRGVCFVNEDDCNVLGMPWVRQLPDLYKAFKKYQIHRTIIVDHIANFRDTIVAKLRTEFADVFKPSWSRTMYDDQSNTNVESRRPTRVQKETPSRDYRNGYPRWSPGRVQLRHGQCLYDVQVDDRLWRRQANQLRPATHTTADSKLMDEFDFPLLPCVNDDPPIQDSSTTYRKDQTSTTPLPTPVPVHRPSRTQRPQLRLQVDPRRKTSTTDDSLTREVL